MLIIWIRTHKRCAIIRDTLTIIRALIDQKRIFGQTKYLDLISSENGQTKT